MCIQEEEKDPTDHADQACAPGKLTVRRRANSEWLFLAANLIVAEGAPILRIKVHYADFSGDISRFVNVE
jgi:hypothetical protein